MNSRFGTAILGGTLALAACGDAPGEASDGNEEESTSENDDESTPDRDLQSACTEPDPEECEFLFADEERRAVALAPCTRHRWWIAVPAESTFTLTVKTDGPLDVRITYPDTLDWEDPLTAVDVTGEVEIPFVAPRSGEFAVLLAADELDSTATYDLSVRCTGGCERETTRFPVVLVHGWMGFEDIGPVDYFFGVPDELNALGYPYAIAVLDPFNSHVVRSDQLSTLVDTVLVDQRARKVDLLAHSQGGLDSRYLISTLGYGDRVAALTTVATPHRGTPIADVALGLKPGPTDEALFFLLELLGAAGGQESDAEASFTTLSETFVQNEFNPENPDHPDVDYVSWMGKTCLSLAACGDVVDAPIAAGYDMLAVLSGENDGIVPVSSAPWGDYRGTVPADHFDEVGQVAGQTGPNFDHLEFYRARVRDLRDARN